MIETILLSKKLSWTPDGKLVYTAMERDNRDIWIMNADGSNAKQLTFEVSADLDPSVSPDGRYIVFESNRDVGWGVWRMNIDGSSPVELAKNIGDEVAIPQFSAGSRFVIYAARTTGTKVLWQVPTEGGAPQQLTDKQMFSQSVSPDGKLIAYYYRGPEPNAKQQAQIISADGGPAVKTFTGLGDGSRMRWSPDGLALDYIETREGVANLWRQPLDGGAARQLTNWGEDLIFRFAWSNDGKQLACTRGVHGTDLVLLEDLDLSQR